MTDPDPERFDVSGPLPGRGVTLLEASAGTGKTFTIAALVARFVAEGVPVDRILAVTFTRMATAELRGRVRERLVATESRLGLLLDTGRAGAAADVVDELLATGSPGEVDLRRRRLAAAVADFDAATITTTHGFCHLVLASLGVSGGVGLGAVLTEDASDTVSEVVDDLYTRWALRHDAEVPLEFALRAARAVAGAAVQNPDTELAAVDGDPGSGAALQRRLAAKVRTEVARRLIEANLLTYDDLLMRLKGALKDPEQGATACAILRDRYDVVLVDEFQDTDPTQWEVVKKAFGGGETALVLIGDPKQAIYSFRGGDVYSYLEAAATADRRFTLAENWRSDGRLIAAFDVLMSPLQLGHAGIPYRRVTVPAVHEPDGLVGAANAAPLRVRMLHGKDPLDVDHNKTGIAKASAEAWIARDLACDVVDLLRSGAQLTRDDTGGAVPGGARPVGPGDVAVLVRTNKQAQQVEAALLAAGVPAVVGASDPVFHTPSARHWMRLMEALEQPASRSRAAALGLTPFIGMSAADVANASEYEWEELHARIHTWAEVLRRRGVAALFRAATVDMDVAARVLRNPGGPRLLTDLGHIAQLLHAESSISLLGPSALRAWLSRRTDVDFSEGDIEERTRRLESDADAVQVLTVHRSKGLEFPIVYCPYLWDCGRSPSADEPVVYHDPVEDYSRRLDVGMAGDPPSFKAHRGLQLEEQRGEDIRLLYVALSRARHRVVLWWVRAWESHNSPLGRILMSRDADGSVRAKAKYPHKDSEVHDELTRLASQRPGLISVERCVERPAERWNSATGAAPILRSAAFDRHLDLSWRRTSYSAIVAAGDQSGTDPVSSEPEDPGTTDEPDAPAGGSVRATVSSPGAPGAAGAPGAGSGPPPDGDIEEELRSLVVPLADVPGGTDVGTFVHHVLERIDFTAGDLRSEVESALRLETSRRPLDLGDHAAVTDGLVAAIETPLGPLAGGLRLRDLARSERLDEMGFELPLAGGEHPSGSVPMDDVARLFEDHSEPGGPLAGYAARLANPLLGTDLRGYLTGSLDLVLRVTDEEGESRFVIADYKTNRLSVEGERLSAWHYRPAALDAEMQHAHYPLQAILYSVALHRYLRWRIPGYDPARHLGGVLYLFVRGMTGPDCPTVDGQVCGVFSWKPSAALVTDLSDLFDEAGDIR